MYSEYGIGVIAVTILAIVLIVKKTIEEEINENIGSCRDLLDSHEHAVRYTRMILEKRGIRGRAINIMKSAYREARFAGKFDNVVEAMNFFVPHYRKALKEVTFLFEDREWHEYNSMDPFKLRGLYNEFFGHNPKSDSCDPYKMINYLIKQ